MANQWYYARNNQQAGPVTFEQLQHLAVTGGLIGTDLVWTEGMSAWTPAATTPGLFAAPGGAAPAGSNFATPYSAPAGGMPAGQGPYSGPQQPGPQFLGYYSQMSSGAPHYAGFWIRFVAIFIDGIILLAAYVFLKTVLGIVSQPMPFHFGNTGAPVYFPIDPLGSPGWWLNIVLSYGYFVGMESSATQATLGKMAVGIKVIDYQGNRISVPRALGRRAGKMLSDLILFIGYIMVAFTDRKQGLHDMMASTLVVYK